MTKLEAIKEAYGYEKYDNLFSIEYEKGKHIVGWVVLPYETLEELEKAMTDLEIEESYNFAQDERNLSRDFDF